MDITASQKLDQLLIPGTDRDVAARYHTLAQRAKGATFGLLEEEYVVVDTETTGVSFKKDQLIEVAAAILDGPNIVARFSTFVDPGMEIPEHIQELTHITPQDVEGAPSPQEAVASLERFVDGRPLIAHNASFDENFIKAAAPEMGYLANSSVWLDSLELARIALPRLRTHNLADLSAAFEAHPSSHRAIDDVDALCAVWRVLLTAIGDLPEGLPAYLGDLFPQEDWPLRRVFRMVAGTRPGDRPFSLKSVRVEQSHKGRGEHKYDAAEVIEEMPLWAPSPQLVEEAFSPQGVVGRMYDDYEPRAEQVAMAQSVAKAFGNSSNRVIEAGTGVGKSMAYLVPAALFAKANHVTVGVATKTNALLDQLVHRELPLLDANLEGGVVAVAVKGYDHYPCMRKLQRFIRNHGKSGANHDAVHGDDDEPTTHAAGISRQSMVMAAVLLTFSCQTTQGDIDALPLYWRELPKKEVCASSEDCLHVKCPYFRTGCLIHGARRAAANADIVVTNHALLFRDTMTMGEGRVLPPIRHWIVDEAHGAEAESRRQTACEVDARSLLGSLATLSSRDGAAGQMKQAAARLEGGGVLVGLVDKVQMEAEQAASIATSLASFIKDLDSVAENSSYDKVELWVDERVRESSAWSILSSVGMSLADRLEQVVKSCNNATDMSEQFGELIEEKAALVSAMCEVGEQRSALLTILDGDDDSLVYAAEFDRRPDVQGEKLTAQRVEMGPALAECFYPEMLSVIYTSATIATGESFSHFEVSTGLNLLEEPAATEQLASSYDFDNNMTVYLPKGMPAPSDSSYLEDLETLLLQVHEAMGGSVLTLFTNRREMDKLYEKIRPILKAEGIELICQSHGYSTKRIRDEFLANPKTSLFALRSFWEGFDAPGDTLRCVVVPKLPFGRPTDPLSCARSLRDSRAWWNHSLPEAVIDLKQAAGRLIRSTTDRGCLVLADSRLLTKGYGKDFLQALPTRSQVVCTVEEMLQDMRERWQ